MEGSRYILLLTVFALALTLVRSETPGLFHTFTLNYFYKVYVDEKSFDYGRGFESYH